MNMKVQPRRAKDALITDENRKESERLKALYKNSGHGLTQEAFGQEFNIGNQGTVWQCLNANGMPISMKAAQGFAKGLNCEIADFSPRLDALAKGILESLGQSLAGEDGDSTRTSWTPKTEPEYLEVTSKELAHAESTAGLSGEALALAWLLDQVTDRLDKKKAEVEASAAILRYMSGNDAAPTHKQDEH